MELANLNLRQNFQKFACPECRLHSKTAVSIQNYFEFQRVFSSLKSNFCKYNLKKCDNFVCVRSLARVCDALVVNSSSTNKQINQNYKYFRHGKWYALIASKWSIPFVCLFVVIDIYNISIRLNRVALSIDSKHANKNVFVRWMRRAGDKMKINWFIKYYIYNAKQAGRQLLRKINRLCSLSWR